MSELAQAIEEMRNMRESYDALAGAVVGATAGKPELAAAISAKGVPATTQDGLADMAAKVRQIPQELNTGVSDFEQVIAPSPYIWNVYSVANDLMKDTLPAYIPAYMSEYKQRYGANSFFVGEYYLGYDTLPLTGADGYLTCDGDFYTIADGVVTHTAPDGTVETYSAEEIIHTWHDSESGRCNRWVAFFYLANAYSFTNVTSSICPRRVALCGECTSFVVSGENRLTDVWVIGTLGHFEGGTTGNTWNPAQVIRHYAAHDSGFIYTGFAGISCIIPDLTQINGTPSLCAVFKNNGAQTIILPLLSRLTGAILYGEDGVNAGSNIERIVIKGLREINGNILKVINSTVKHPFLVNLQDLILEDTEVISAPLFAMSTYNSSNNQGGLSKIKRIYMPKAKVINSNIFSFNMTTNNSPGTEVYQAFRIFTDIVVGELETSLYLRQWQADGVSDFSEIVNNIKNHFLANVSDRTGQNQLVFTVGTRLYNNIATENIEWHGETMTLADAFLTKNWLLAGA